jgi:hypothetical protein
MGLFMRPKKTPKQTTRNLTATPPNEFRAAYGKGEANDASFTVSMRWASGLASIALLAFPVEGFDGGSSSMLTIRIG